MYYMYLPSGLYICLSEAKLCRGDLKLYLLIYSIEQLNLRLLHKSGSSALSALEIKVTPYASTLCFSYKALWSMKT